MLNIYIIKQKIAVIILMLIFVAGTGFAQKVNRPQPKWWFGESAAANFNFYRGTTQMINQDFSTPTAFHKGSGVRPYFSLLAEYRPNRTIGGMLNVAYDNRGGKFESVIAPCNCPADLSTNVSYIAIEPSLRVAPFSNAFYLFAGPTLSFNITKDYLYTQEKQADRRGEWSDVQNAALSAQAGMGVDIALSKRTNPTQFTLSPFAAFLTDFGRDPRTTGEWSIYTIRTGIALKFGTAKVPATPVAEAPVLAVVEEVDFSVRAPKNVPYNRQVKETFPLRNSVFFDMGSVEIPNRYVLLNKNQANSFKEEQLQQGQPANLNYGRSSRQLAVYYNIMNIMGDRLRANPNSTLSLNGSSHNNPAEGKEMAENVKAYLVDVFGINASRITTTGSAKPATPSEKSGAVNDIALLREGDRRVDMESHSTELLMQVGGKSSPFMKPVQIIAVQENPMDSHVIFTADGASELLSSWTVELTDDNGNKQKHGPYTGDQASVPGNTILGANTQGNYKVVMLGQTKDGKAVTEESYVSLVKKTDQGQEGLRYSILFDFDESKSIAAYENFLADVVAPLIPGNATVIIHGHTDIIGSEGYNHTLSHDRAMEAQRIINSALVNSGKKGVKFETNGYGESESMSPFDNNLPEKRFYNRTIIIDIIPAP